MGESTKAITALVMILGGVVALFAWVDDRPDVVTWSCRLGGLGVVVLAGSFLTWLQFRSDLEFDYLGAEFGVYFNRNGFCFAVRPTAVSTAASVDLYFQSQFAGPCIGQVALRPAYERDKEGRAKLDTITCRIECPSGAFGVARIPIAIPEALQGRSQPYDVGASVIYPEGKGERLRFYDGVLLRSDTNFRDGFGTALTLASAAAGSIVLSKPATTTVKLPRRVDAIQSDVQAPKIEILWKLGDGPLYNHA